MSYIILAARFKLGFFFCIFGSNKVTAQDEESSFQADAGSGTFKSRDR